MPSIESLEAMTDGDLIVLAKIINKTAAQTVCLCTC